VFIKLATLTDKPLYKQIAEDHLDYWQNRIKSTPGGLKYLDSWGVCKYPAAESMVQLVYYKYTGTRDALILQRARLTTYLEIILKKCPMWLVLETIIPNSRITGLQAADLKDRRPTKQRMIRKGIFYMALWLVSGYNDEYYDDIDKYVYSETGLDYNAGLVGALAGMSKYFGQGQMPKILLVLKVSRLYTMQTQKYTKKMKANRKCPWWHGEQHHS